MNPLVLHESQDFFSPLENFLTHFTYLQFVIVQMYNMTCIFLIKRYSFFFVEYCIIRGVLNFVPRVHLEVGKVGKQGITLVPTLR